MHENQNLRDSVKNSMTFQGMFPKNIQLWLFYWNRSNIDVLMVRSGDFNPASTATSQHSLLLHFSDPIL